MRYLYAAVAVIFMLGTSVVSAEEPQSVAGAGRGAVIVNQEKEIITDTNEERSDDEEFGENDRREMPQYETYDENTGLPDVVESDREGEIE
jgi:hypothetical protein